MNSAENGLLRKDCASSFLAYCEVSKRVLKFQTNFIEVVEVTGEITFKFDFKLSNLVINIVKCCMAPAPER